MKQPEKQVNEPVSLAVSMRKRKDLYALLRRALWGITSRQWLQFQTDRPWAGHRPARRSGQGDFR